MIETSWVVQHEDGHTVPVVVDGDTMTYTVDAPGRWQIVPKPPTLREQVAREITRHVNAAYPDEIADAVLAVVADWLAAQPVHDGTAAGLWALEPRLAQRDRDVRLLRGES